MCVTVPSVSDPAALMVTTSPMSIAVSEISNELHVGNAFPGGEVGVAVGAGGVGVGCWQSELVEHSLFCGKHKCPVSSTH